MAQRCREGTREFTQEEVRLSELSEVSLADVACIPGIEVKLLYRWRTWHLAKGEQVFPGFGRRSAEDKEAYRLGRGLATVLQERDIRKERWPSSPADIPTLRTSP